MNWQAIVKTLLERGWTQQTLATECGCSQSSISGIANGDTVDPRASIGLALMRLHDADGQAGAQTEEVAAGAPVVGA